MAAMNPSIPTSPTVTPHAASIAVDVAKLSGNNSEMTRKIIAPPAKPRLEGSSGWKIDTSKNAGTATIGCGMLVRIE